MTTNRFPRAWTRRDALRAGIAGAASLAIGHALPTRAASRTLNVLAHRVHQNSLTTGVAGDLTEPWRKSHDADIVWTTFDTDPLQDRLLREASLGSTDFGATSRLARELTKLSRADPTAGTRARPTGRAAPQASRPWACRRGTSGHHATLSRGTTRNPRGSAHRSG